MERHLRTTAHWLVWLELLRAHPDREAELAARASLLAERHPGEEGVVRAMLEASRIEREIDLPEPEERRAPRPWWLAGVALALAAGVAIGLRVAPPATSEAPTWRGASRAVGGDVTLEQGGAPLGRAVIGSGQRPALSAGSGPIVVRWRQADLDGTRRVVAWVAADGRIQSLAGVDGAVTPLTEDREWTPPALPATLVVAEVPGDAEDGALAARIVDGRAADVGPLGEVAFVAFDLAPR